jgi:predicted nucleic acid-binding protein
MRPIIFVDTSAWLALVNKSDTFHLKAKESRDNLARHVPCEPSFTRILSDLIFESTFA